jgi:hypothetical protein
MTPATPEYGRDELLEYLREAEDVLGEPPSQRQMNDLDGFPTRQPYAREFGSWSSAKEAAGVSESASGWEKAQECTKLGVYRDALAEAECVACDEDADCAITFHHPSGVEKRDHVAQMRQSSEWDASDMRDEIDKCVAICANCHAKHHSDSHSFTVGDCL